MSLQILLTTEIVYPFIVKAGIVEMPTMHVNAHTYTYDSSTADEILECTQFEG